MTIQQSNAVDLIRNTQEAATFGLSVHDGEDKEREPTIEHSSNDDYRQSEARSLQP